MTHLTLDITNVLSKTIGDEGIDRVLLGNVASKINRFKKTVYDTPYPFMDFSLLRSHLKDVNRVAEDLKKTKINNLILLGIGGSSLGTETIFHALLDPLHNLKKERKNNAPRYFILDNIDPSRIKQLADLAKAERKETLLIVISKSGETPETMSQFMVFKDILSIDKDYKKRIVIVTDKNKGMLREIAKREGYPSLPVPEGIGGRFSVLTPVGMLPASIMGIDIKKILDGAEEMSKHIEEAYYRKNLAVVIASILYLMDKKGKPMHVMMPYCERLNAFADWFRQLEAESLGKKGRGPTPLKSTGVTDQHSQLQLYIDGPKDKCITFLYSVDECLPIPDSFSYIEELNYLAGKDMKALFHAEFLGTRRSLTDAKIPNITITLDEISPFNIGALFFLYEMVIAFMGFLYEVNAFDQPAVELGKIYTKAIMGKKGLEEKGRIIEKELKGKRVLIEF
ncbi:MAG TPA: hypothetical protein PLW88_06200 [Syntrophorhabdaceae bacterium]|nr:hypothetical protein [Syntrophorhabdaceae bacterium]